MAPVRIFDTTLRDGEQTPGVNLSPAEKLEIARHLARLRVDVIEAGFPISSKGEFEAVRAIAREISGPVIAGLARINPEDIYRAYEAVKEARRPMIHTFVATSEIHMRYKLRKSPEEIIEMTRVGVRTAKSLTNEVEFSAEDATRSDPAFLCKVFQVAVDEGATCINIPDTVGYTTPAEFKRLVGTIRANVRGIENVIISVHCHDDLGLAVANSLSAVEAGASQIECTVNGIGERAGNTSLEEVVMALRTRKDHFGTDTLVVSEQIYRVSRLVSALTGVPIQPNKAIVGANAFAHQSGIHQDGVLKERLTYEIIRPETIGLSSSRIVLGKVSGRHAFSMRLEELGYSVSQEEVDKLFVKFKELADRKRDISDKDIEALVDSELFRVPECVVLDYYHVSAGNRTVPTATVRLSVGSSPREEAASGDGPVDALFKAIDRCTGLCVTLTDYSLRAVTSGKDALGEVTLKITHNGRSFSGRGLSMDVIEASARAYVDAINRLYHSGPEERAQTSAAG